MKKSKGISIETLMKHMSPSALKLNSDILEGKIPINDAKDALKEKVVPLTKVPGFSIDEKCCCTQIDSGRKRIDTLNKTERRYYDMFLEKEVKDNIPVFIQASRFFELDGGGTYTPDFMVLRDYGLEVIEIKGGYSGPGWEQGIERYKRVCSQYDSDRIRFKMATWDRKKREWKIVDRARH